MRTLTAHRSVLAGMLTAMAIASGSIPHAQVPAGVLDHDRQTAQLAIEAAGRGPATPIPLMGDRSRLLGVVYDPFVTAVQIARSRISAGLTVTPDDILAHPNWKSRALVVVAYPVDCDGKPNHPKAIRWVPNGQLPVPITVIGQPVRGDQAMPLLPDVGLPADALVVAYNNLPPMATVEIDYDAPVCRAGATTASLPINMAPSRTLSTAFLGIKLPEKFASLPSPTTVRMRVTLDPAGIARFPEQVQGPPELGPAAIEAMAGRAFPPGTINGVAMPATMIIPFVFTTTGTPAIAAPFNPSALTAAPPGVQTMTSSSIVAVPVPPQAPQLPPVAPAPAGQANAQLTRLAIETGERAEPMAVPLDAAGPATHGVLYDGFLVTALRARAAMKEGHPIDPAAPSVSAIQEDLVAVAFPLTCNGKTIAPTDIGISKGGTTPGPLRETSALLFRHELDARLPGVSLPAGAAGRAFANIPLSQNLEVRVTYAEPPCGASSAVVTLPIQWVRGQIDFRYTTTRLPSGSALPSPTVVRIRSLIDTNGSYRYPSLADGPAELGPVALTTASNWKSQPYKANGTPMPQAVISTLTFTTTGMPEPAATTTPPVMANTTVNGRPPSMTTPDVPGLSVATSKCEIATDASYGVTPGSAIKVGGDFAEGPARERQFLTALRGPNGQGLNFVRRGSLMGPDKQTILDLYEISYAGLAKPIQVYLDEYHEEPLKAPQGLVCASAIAK